MFFQIQQREAQLGKHYNKGPNLNQAWELLEIHMEKQKQWWTMVTNQSWVNSAKQTKKHSF